MRNYKLVATGESLNEGDSIDYTKTIYGEDRKRRVVSFSGTLDDSSAPELIKKGIITDGKLRVKPGGDDTTEAKGADNHGYFIRKAARHLAKKLGCDVEAVFALTDAIASANPVSARVLWMQELLYVISDGIIKFGDKMSVNDDETVNINASFMFKDNDDAMLAVDIVNELVLSRQDGEDK